MTGDWRPVGSIKDLARQRRTTVSGPAGDVVVFWHDGCPYALANICIHQERELVKGTLFQDRVVCPGHQWAFQLGTGYCKERDRYQPAYRTRVVDGTVEVDLSAPVPAG